MYTGHTIFVDEQRLDPYALWHHRHHFREVKHGVKMTDEVNYAIPFGLFGQPANRLFVSRQLNVIFDHRYKMLEDFFSTKKELNRV